MENDTIWQRVKDNWHITKKRIKELDINPNKEWGDATLNELYILAEELEVTVSELIDYTR